MKNLLFLFLFCSLTGSIFAESVPIPELYSRVTDLTETLSEEQLTSLETKLENFEKKKGSQVVVVIIPTTGEETIEQYSIRLAEKWKIGRKDIADGVIFLIAKNDRKMRFEIGRGLEGAIPDVLSKRIQVEYVKPLFKIGKFYEGIDQGIDSILKLIDGELLPEPTHTTYASDSPEMDNFGIYMILLIVIGIVVGIFFRKLFSLLQAAIATGAGYWLGGFFGLSLEALLPILLIFFFLLLVLYIAAKSAGSGGGGSGYSGSSWSSWSSGGGSDWGSSSGGSFGGGGGDFGGGGSSSDW